MASDLSVLRDVVKVFRDIDPEMPAQYMDAVLIIAQKPGITQVDLAKAIGLSTAAASRIATHVLGLKHKLVEQSGRAGDLRIKEHYLTPKGERVVKALSETIGKK